MTAQILDGKAVAAQVREEVKTAVDTFRAKHGRVPGLHVILAGDDPASAVYVRNKEKAALEVGIAGAVHRLPKTVSEGELVELVTRLNDDPNVDGILVQLPLPKGVREERILDLVDPRKDVDGFHPVNAGRLSSGRAGLVPCTPLGCMRLLDVAGVDLKGARAVVVGRSNIVGKPVAQLLLARHATVTIAHSRTKDLPALCREADVLVAAIGKAEMIGAEHVREGAVVIDVGINRIDVGDGKTKLVGDVAFAAVVEKARAITPVPGGVGPLTIAMLLANTVQAAEARLSGG